jgi:pimeloyl-ACP methyl ester carboxylesterase
LTVLATTGLALISALVGLAFITLMAAQWLNRRYPPPGRILSVEGVFLHLMEQGRAHPDKPTLVFIHGASSNHREFQFAVAERIKERFGADQHAVYVDRPGQGASARRPGDHSPKVQAQRILGALDQLGVGRFVAVGHSWGGSVAAQLPLLAPDRVQGTVFLAPATHPWPGGVDWFYGAADGAVLGRLFCWLFPVPVGWFQIEPGVERVFSPEAPVPGYRKALAPKLVLRPASFRANAQDVYRLKPFVTEEAPRYRQIRCPVTIITGDADKVVWPSIHSDGLERDIEGAKKIVIHGGGHMPHQTHPDLLVEEIAAMMAQAALEIPPRTERIEAVAPGAA